MYTHRGAYLNALGEVIVTAAHAARARLPLDAADVPLQRLVLPLGGDGRRRRATSACARSTRPASGELIDERGRDALCGAPTVLIGVAEPPGRAPARAGPCTVHRRPARRPSPTLIARLEELGFRVVHVYGLTETYGPHTVCEWQPDVGRAATPTSARACSARQGVGLRRSPTACASSTTTMHDVPADGETMGEVVMRGNNVMNGYYDDPEAHRAGRSAAAGSTPATSRVMHPDGYIELRDRNKDIIISGGENISTIEVEQALAPPSGRARGGRGRDPGRELGRAAEGVRDAAPGRERDAEELIAHCRERLAHFKAPEAVEFGELPKTSTGKVQKFVLRDREWGDRETRIN